MLWSQKHGQIQLIPLAHEKQEARHLHLWCKPMFTFQHHFILHVQKLLHLQDLTVNWSKLFTFSLHFNNSWSNFAGATKIARFRDFNTRWVRPEPTTRALFWNFGKWKRNAKVALWKILWYQGWSSPQSKFRYFTIVCSFKHHPCFRWEWEKEKTANWHVSPIRKCSILRLHRTSLIHTKLWNGFVIFNTFHSLVLLR